MCLVAIVGDWDKVVILWWLTSLCQSTMNYFLASKLSLTCPPIWPRSCSHRDRGRHFCHPSSLRRQNACAIHQVRHFQVRKSISSGTSLLPTACEVWGKVMFSQACVILSIGGGCVRGVFVSRSGCPGVCVQRGVLHTPPICRDMVNWRSVRILLECFLVLLLFPKKKIVENFRTSSMNEIIIWAYMTKYPILRPFG